MKKDKFLISIVITIIVLMGLAVAVFFARQGVQDYVSEDTPDGIVHNYVYAIQQEDYQKAYGYLAEGDGKPTILEFRTYYQNNPIDRYGIQIKNTEIYDDDKVVPVALVNIVVIEASNDPLNSGYRSSGSVALVFQDGNWKVNEFPYRLWPWEWFQIDYP